MLYSIRRQLVDRHSQRLSSRRAQGNRRSNRLDTLTMRSPSVIRMVGRQLGVEDLRHVGASPAARSDEAVAARKGQDATAHYVHVTLNVRSSGLPQDRLHDRQEVLRAMIDLSRKKPLLFLARSQLCGLCQQRLAKPSICAMANLSAPMRSTSAYQ
jgi:hypothetical protein